MSGYDQLKLENQLCFPLYACAKELVRQYTPLLDELGLTYTQYIVMMVLWDQGQLSVKELGQYLYLDSGTLTPLLKKLETSGWVKRTRDAYDERVVQVAVTEIGLKLREKAQSIPSEISGCLNLEPDETKTLYHLLYKMLNQFK